MDEWMREAAHEIDAQERATTTVYWIACIIERHYRAALPTSLTELSKEMGDAGYMCPTCGSNDPQIVLQGSIEENSCYQGNADDWHSSPAPAPQTPEPSKPGRRMASRNEYQSCPNCDTRWYANEVLTCPKCEPAPAVTKK